MAKKEKTSSIRLEPIEVTADGGEIYSMNDLEMVELQTAASLEDYHTQLSQIIKKIRGFNDEELDRFAEVVSRPWKRPRGRPSEINRDADIFVKYIARKEGQPKIPRKIVLEGIKKDYGVTDDTARKIYEKLGGDKE